MGIIIDPVHIRLTENYRTIIQINNDKQLFVNGVEKTLNAEQTQLVTEYSSSIRQQIPQMVSLVSEGVEIGLQTIDKVIAGLTGENSQAHQKIQDTFTDIQQRLKQRFNHSDQSYFIAPQDIRDFDEFFTRELSKELEDMVSGSLGSLLTAFTSADETERNLEQRVEAFGKQLDVVDSDIGNVLQNRTLELKTKALAFCNTLVYLDEIENKLQKAMPELARYDAIYVRPNN